MAYKQKGHCLPGINQRLDSKNDPRGNSSAFQQRSLVSVADSLSSDAQTKHDALQTKLHKDQDVTSEAAQNRVNSGEDLGLVQSELDIANDKLQETAQFKSDSTWASNKAQFGPLATELRNTSTGAGWDKMLKEFNVSEEKKKNQ